MSSVLRSHSAMRSPDSTKFHHIKTAGYYNDLIGSVMPVPFVCRNGVIDINLEDDVESQLIESETAGTRYIEGLCKSMGGITVVTSLGPNFIRWLNNWVADFYDSSVIDTFSVYTPATMTKVQVTDEDSYDFNVLENDINNAPWGVSEYPTTSDEYTRGNPSNNYYTCWVFKTPLTIKFMYDGSPYYLTYNTTFAPVYD